jgi:hypothetical protein
MTDRFADRTTITIDLEKRESDKSFEYADNGDGRRTTRATIKTTLPGFYLAQSLGMEIYTNEITGIDRKNINVTVKKGNSFTFGRLENGERRSLSLRDIPNLIKANKTIKEIDNNKIKDKSLREIGIYLEIAK